MILIPRKFNHFRNLKIQDKFFISFVVIILISVLSVGISSYSKSSSILGEKTSKYNFETVQQISTSVDYTLQRIDELSGILSFDQNIQKVLNTDMSHLSEREQIAYINLIESIMITHYNSKIMRSIEIHGNNGMVFKVPSSYSDPDSEADYEKYVKTANTFRGKNKWINEAEPKGLLQSVRQINDLQTTLKPLGIVIISLKYETIAKLLKNINFDNSGSVILIDENEKLVTPDDRFKDNINDLSSIKQKLALDSGSFIQTIGGEKYLLSYKTSDYSSWKIIGIISEKKLYKDSYKIRDWMIIVTLVILVFAFLLARITAQTITIPIRRMLKPMKRVDMGDFNVSFPVHGQDEIGVLSQGINQMLSQIHSLIEVNYKGKIMLQESELKALQAQINPHFLYNTLETINWMAQMNGVEQICGMVTSLGDLMRISISTEKEYISIEEEIKYISDYLFIQKTRFGERIHIDIRIDDSLLPIIIPKLILQPIVENALLHGVQVKKGKGLLNISGKRVDGDILFEIEDNGVGMTPEQMKALLSDRNKQTERRKTGIGIHNVHQRIQYIYGKNYGITLFSEPGQGTKVQILITDTIPEDKQIPST
ncbi:MAG: hypothetical protein JWM44_1405 [Bacilli bacterium]|nr:hypothetical protein [Bacilli bacterium]